jgi:hypothetical protein
MGHWFGDWTHGIDHERCGCGMYRHAFDREPKPCPLGSAPGGLAEPISEDFGPRWAIRPELTLSDIYGDGVCPDVQQFESREETRQWLDATTNGIPNRMCRSYGRIAVRTFQPFEGAPLVGESFVQFLSSGPGLAPWPQFDLETSLRRTLIGEDPPISCKLGLDWDFEGIVRASRFGPGHQFAGRLLVSFPDQITRVIDDLQAGLRLRHPTATVEAECSFLESWDVLSHVAEFCGKVLAPSFEARDLITRAQRNPHEHRRYIEDARSAVRVQLAVYVAVIRNAAVTADPASNEDYRGSDHSRIADGTGVLVQTSDDVQLNSGLRSEAEGKPDLFATAAQRERAILDFTTDCRLATRKAAAKKLGVHYQDLNKWKLHRYLAKGHSKKQDRIENEILTRPAKPTHPPQT